MVVEQVMMKKGRVLRTISSSIREQSPCISCTTFNILAPIYKRVNQVFGSFLSSKHCLNERLMRGYATNLWNLMFLKTLVLWLESF